jgi:hypothetical protein
MGLRFNHAHDDRGGRGADTEMVVGRDLVIYNRCTCSCGQDWNDVTDTRPDPEQQ